MTRSEALFYFCAWARNNLLRHEERVKCVDFIYDLYDKNFEIADRTIDEDTARREEKKIMDEADYAELEKDIVDSMNFDNELSGGE